MRLNEIKQLLIRFQQICDHDCEKNCTVVQSVTMYGKLKYKRMKSEIVTRKLIKAYHGKFL